jgi:hypothetical protein
MEVNTYFIRSWRTISIARLKIGLDFTAHSSYNEFITEQGIDMKPEDFRKFMIDSVRAFDKWAWVDMQQNPEDWNTMTKEDLFQMFHDFIKDDLND